MNRKAKTVADGRKRAYEGSIEHVRAEVETRYAVELESAGVWRRMWLRRKIEREISARIKRIAPDSGLY